MVTRRLMRWRPGDYDILAPNRLLAGGNTTGGVDIGTLDGAFVGEGWHVAERDGGTSFRWGGVRLRRRAARTITLAPAWSPAR